MSKLIINKKKYIWSLIFNILIFLLVLAGLFVGIFIERTNWTILRFFTWQSNILMGIVSFIYLIFISLVLRGKINSIPKPMEIIKLMATAGVVLTFLTVVCFLYPISKQIGLFKESAMFYHVIVPIVSLLTFILFEHSNNKYYYPETFYGLIHIVGYAIFYLVNGLIHIQGGVVPQQYDWYGFFGFLGVKFCWVVIIGMLSLSYLIVWLLWLANKKICIFDKTK